MNPTIFAATLRQRAQSLPRVLLTGAMWVLPLIMIAATKGGVGLEPLNTGAVFALILGAGLIGAEASSGVLQLLFARPVLRAEYVFSRWLAIVAACTLLIVTQVALGGLIVVGNGGDLKWTDVGLRMLAQIANAVGTTSVLTLFSSFLPGIGDVICVILTQLSGSLMEGVGAMLNSPILRRAGREIAQFAGPELPIQLLALGMKPSWFSIVSYASTVTLCLALAILLMNRRELSYASD